MKFKLNFNITPRELLSNLLRQLLVPSIGLLCFLAIWAFVAGSINTSLGKFPGPAKVWEQTESLYQEYLVERAKQAEFNERQDKRIQERLAEDPTASIERRQYTGSPTFIAQIGTSLITVMSGFILASLIAIPVGIMIGLSRTLYQAFNPLIQLFKPISPLAWLPLVTMVVSAVYVTDDPAVSKSYLNSMFTVLLCCLWPTIINTTVGVNGVSQDLNNVSRVLRLGPITHIIKIVLPSAVPMIFTGLRLSLGVAWLVLIAAEMLAQNPGLGKFVWDQFQNGSSDSLGRIMVAVLVIGFIGFLLDRGMLLLQRHFSWDKTATIR
jgi:nitrate/nitrite transport system permease protein